MREDMTDEEADALDELLTRTTPKVPPNRRSYLAQKGSRLVALDDLSEDYLMTRAMAAHKTPTEIIGELVREKIAASV
ncbi:hypothetical protein AGMMS49546_33040 [Spirochaetia bacterium]|nr:hypothetical protein AGMMS49546_33040 [Spirochaetia bacterium]